MNKQQYTNTKPTQQKQEAKGQQNVHKSKTPRSQAKVNHQATKQQNKSTQLKNQTSKSNQNHRSTLTAKHNAISTKLQETILKNKPH